MLEQFWKQVEPLVVQALVILIPTVAAVLVAWLRAKARQWSTAKAIVAELDQSPIMATGPEKKELAMLRLSQAMPRIDVDKAGNLIERVLTEVRRESDSAPPAPPTKR